MPEPIRPPFPAYVDSSMMASFRSCPKSFEYGYLRHLHHTETSIHLVAGGAFAKGLEVTRLKFYTGESDEPTAILAGQRAAIKQWGENDLFLDHNKTLSNVLLAIESYFDRYPMQEDCVQPFRGADGKPAVEFSFANEIPGAPNHPVTGEPILYVGRFDLLGEFNSALFAVDEKTTGSLGPTWLKQWDLRSQFTGYCWAAKEYGFPVVGAIVRGTSFLKSRFDHAEVITYRPDFFIERWLHQLSRDLQRMINCWEEGYFDLSLDSACTSYGGCEYRELCDKMEPEKWIPINFVERRWDPLAKEED